MKADTPSAYRHRYGSLGAAIAADRLGAGRRRHRAALPRRPLDPGDTIGDGEEEAEAHRIDDDLDVGAGPRMVEDHAANIRQDDAGEEDGKRLLAAFDEGPERRYQEPVLAPPQEDHR